MSKTLGELLREKLETMTDHPINVEQPIRKQIRIVRKTEIMNATKILVSIDGRKHLALDFDEQLIHKLVSAEVVQVERDWDGVVKKIECVGKKVNVMLVDASDIIAQQPSNDDKINALKAYQAKLAEEAEMISKEINTLSNT